MPITQALQRRISLAYTTPGHPVAFSAPQRVAKYFNITKKVAKEILEHIEGYTLHREFKRPKVYNTYYVHNRREQVQADLIDIAKISRSNDGITYLLVLIDIFTKYVWVYPIKNKRGTTMKQVLTQWIRSLDTLPRKLLTDKGLEFTNGQVQQLLRQHDIEWQAAYGTLKACIAERVNKTLQILIFKHLTQKETIRYIDVLPQLIKTYNRRSHRTLEGMTPAQADKPRNEAHIQGIFHKKYADMERHRKTTKLPFRVGDLVRLKTQAGKFSSSSRAYAEQFHGEYYNIIRINRTLPIALYYLRSADTGEHVKGGLYANELQRQRGDVYKIEKVLHERGVGARKELFIKWKYFGPQYNEWIKASDVRTVF
jgi:transposase InsO family protein